VDILPPASPIAQQIYDLHFAILWVCVGIFVIVFGAMFYSIFRHRKSVGAKAAHFHENTTIEVIWTVILHHPHRMAYPATKTVLEMKDASSPTSHQGHGLPVGVGVRLLQDGVKFNSLLSTPRADRGVGQKGEAKNADYLLEVDKPMVVPAGKKVRLLVTSNDVIHGWYVPQLGVNQYGIPGYVKDTWFKADKPASTAAVQPDLRQGARLHAIVVVAKPPRSTPPG